MPEHFPRRRMSRASARLAAALAAASCLLGASLALAPAAHAAPPVIGEVTVTSTPSVNVGDAVDVVVSVADASSADVATDLYAYSLTIEFDPALLTYSVDSAVFPAGGFDFVAEDAGSLTFTNTRLGTSPGLEGAQQLVAFSFSGAAAGEAAITATTASFISSTGESIGLGEPVASVTEIVAVVGPTPTATPSATPSPTTTTPAVVGDTAGESSGDPLAATGQDAIIWLIVGGVAAAAVAAGAILVARRRAVSQ